jgi:hypothetical protein
VGTFAIISKHPDDSKKTLWVVSGVKQDGSFTHCGTPLKQMKIWGTRRGAESAHLRMLNGPDKKYAEMFEVVELPLKG